ncbi:MAG: ABC transporter ATP-binding protein [Actinobacteria bacterium]|nr:ABC transporter ATP-binding protein [Actinomycetota bacterium]
MSRQAFPYTAGSTTGTGLPGCSIRPVPALRIVDLVKSFGDKRAVDGLSLDVPPGSMYGLVGPNGAGKTTTLSMVTGLLRPDSGRVEVLGHDVWTDPVRAKALIGVLPDGLHVFDRLSGRELIRYVALLRGLDRRVADSRADELLHALGLAEDAELLVCDYSTGMTKKIGLACALVHAPRLLILDEPFEAVDPVSGDMIRQILRTYVASGGTVLLSSHVMEIVEALCDSLAVMAHGRVQAAGTLDDVRQGESLTERFLDLVGAQHLESESLAWLSSSSD